MTLDRRLVEAVKRGIVTGAWWDYVDDVAVHRVGPLLRAYPRPMRGTLLAWSRDADMWLRRTSIKNIRP